MAADARSTPLAHDPSHDLDGNTTQRLIADIEALRSHLEVDTWLLNGVSWGSTLALAYAQAHPERVLGIVLMAVTTTSRAEVDWVTEGVGMIYPEAWDRLARHAEDAGIGYQRYDERLISAYARLMRSPDPAVRTAAVDAWADWEDIHVSIGAGGFHRNPRWDDPTSPRSSPPWSRTTGRTTASWTRRSSTGSPRSRISPRSSSTAVST